MNRLSIIAARHRLGDLATSSSGNVGAHGGWFCYLIRLAVEKNPFPQIFT